MNQQLWNAHLENLELRRQLRDLGMFRRRKQRCIYCGAFTDSNLRACGAHRDLPAIDPEYAGGRLRIKPNESRVRAQ